MILDIKNKEFRDKPIWCVYGPECFPTIFCCKIVEFRNGLVSELNIWGYSVYEGSPGFRTLGRSLKEWSGDVKCRYGTDPIFFDQQADALTYLAKITNPDELRR
jgi:hypothetical protein